MTDKGAGLPPVVESIAVDVANAATVTIVRMFHALVPVLDYLERSGCGMSNLVESGLLEQLDQSTVTVLKTFLSKWSEDAWYLTNVIHEQARLLGYPIEGTLAQFRESHASATTLEEMRAHLNELNDDTLTKLAVELADGT